MARKRWLVCCLFVCFGKHCTCHSKHVGAALLRARVAWKRKRLGRHSEKKRHFSAHSTSGAFPFGPMPPKPFMAAPLGESDGTSSSSSSDAEAAAPPKPAARAVDPESLNLTRPDILSVKEPSPDPGAWEWGGGGNAASREAEAETVKPAGREETRAAVASVVTAAARAVAAAKKPVGKDRPETFKDKEKRKRDKGQQGRNYIEESKRQAREAGVWV